MPLLDARQMPQGAWTLINSMLTQEKMSSLSSKNVEWNEVHCFDPGHNIILPQYLPTQSFLVDNAMIHYQSYFVLYSPSLIQASLLFLHTLQVHHLLNPTNIFIYGLLHCIKNLHCHCGLMHGSSYPTALQCQRGLT